jgi:hypothetical protein
MSYMLRFRLAKTNFIRLIRVHASRRVIAGAGSLVEPVLMVHLIPLFFLVHVVDLLWLDPANVKCCIYGGCCYSASSRPDFGFCTNKSTDGGDCKSIMEGKLAT